MMKVIFSIFTLYQLSMGNRLLQQFPPAQQPPMGTPPVPPMAPPALPPAQPLNPPPAQLPPQQPVPVMPLPPQAPAPAAPVTPAVPAPPAGPQAPIPGVPATPQAPFPGQPVPGVPATPVQPAPAVPAPAAPVYPWQVPQGPQQTGTLFECTVSPPAMNSCAGKVNQIMNPMEGFELLCGGMPGSCYQSQMNIGFLQNGPFVETITFAGTSDYALAGATIYMVNYSGNQIAVDQVLCDKRYSCAGLTIVLGQDMVLEQGAFFCPGMGACDGCIVKQSPYDFGQPCSTFAEPI